MSSVWGALGLPAMINGRRDGCKAMEKGWIDDGDEADTEGTNRAGEALIYAQWLCSDRLSCWRGL